MKRQSVNLRQAYASNPTRFLAVAPPRLVARSRITSELEPIHHVAFARQQRIDAQAQPLADQLRELGLYGMARALARLQTDPSGSAALFDGGLSLLIDGESADRKEKRLAGRLRAARLRYQASIADVDYNAARGFDDALFHWLAIGEWIADRENLIIDGPTGVGKTWLACALGEKACRDDRSVRYERLPRLLADLSATRGTAQYARRMRALHNTELLILDDWGMEPFGVEQRHDALEIIEDRCGLGSTLIASQVAVERWPEVIGDAAVAAAMLDRITHNAHRLPLKGGSLRDQHKIGERSHVVHADEQTAQADARIHSV
jgi:DNA replication protein DnaC